MKPPTSKQMHEIKKKNDPIQIQFPKGCKVAQLFT